MKAILKSATVLLSIIVLGIAGALYLVSRPLPPRPEAREVFDFADAAGGRASASALPEIQRYPARDGTQLAYRSYDSASARDLIFVHGSSYHGASYHALAQSISEAGLATVHLPNLRGHYLSGARRGDVDYIGQLEDDLADLVEHLRARGRSGPFVLGGHSSGGGLAIRFAGGEHGHLVMAYLLLSPVIPLAPTTRGGDAGGWAQLHRSRLFGLLALDALGVDGFDGLPVIRFNKPEAYWDGTETLSYSHRLNASYHPRYDYAADIASMGDLVLVLVGEDDEANDPAAYAEVFSGSGSGATIERLPGVDHFGVFSAPPALDAIRGWLGRLPGGSPVAGSRRPAGPAAEVDRVREPGVDS